MGSLKLALEQGAPKRLELTWGFGHSNFEARLDGRTILSAQSSGELKNGIHGQLPDGTVLDVRLISNGLQQQLMVLRDSEPVPGSPTHPLTQVKTAAYVLYLVAGFSAVFGVILAGGDAEGSLLNAVGPWMFALTFAVLGFFALRPSWVAIAIGAVLYASDALFTLYELTVTGKINVFWIAIRIVFLFLLINGAKAARQWKLQSQRAKPTPAV